MAVLVKTATPLTLLRKIKSSIDDGLIETWEYDEDGDFTHSPDQWRYKAWLRPVKTDDGIAFGILSPRDTDLSTVDYAVYHGRFAEMLLAHFDKDCKDIRVSPMPTKYDLLR